MGRANDTRMNNGFPTAKFKELQFIINVIKVQSLKNKNIKCHHSLSVDFLL